MFQKSNIRPFSGIFGLWGYLWPTCGLLNKAEQVLFKNNNLPFAVVNPFFHPSLKKGKKQCIR
ncbi:hypothetical protein LEP1GSC040_0075 [Leptospira santarosai str. 2000030832]|nr:hypothetical protein LEP1GSC040_0075 [Leptospira santarosai str. 2000030832]